MTNFSDTITDSITALMGKLDSIAQSVTFRMPAVAAGSILPYNVSGKITEDYSGVSAALTASNEDLENVIIQATNNAALAIVRAIEENQKRGDGLNTRSLTNSVIEEINRRTKAQGSSPLVL